MKHKVKWHHFPARWSPVKVVHGGRDLAEKVAGSEENTEKRKKELRKRNNLKWGVPILFPFTRTVVEATENLLGRLGFVGGGGESFS
ncbi:hypothetical protein P8452_47393 [Trifolium repens]|nr:hypothetical protein P8452_47393 [Trifolium repens]